jgi:hypothetical protein
VCLSTIHGLYLPIKYVHHPLRAYSTCLLLAYYHLCLRSFVIGKKSVIDSGLPNTPVLILVSAQWTAWVEHMQTLHGTGPHRASSHLERN